MSDDTPALSAIRIETLSATRAQSDEALVASWLDSLRWAHSRRNFAMTAQRFLAALPMGLRTATVEDVRDAILAATVGASTATTRQYTLRIKSLLAGVHALQCRRADQGAKRRWQPRCEPGQADHDACRGGITDPCSPTAARTGVNAAISPHWLSMLMDRTPSMRVPHSMRCRRRSATPSDPARLVALHPCSKANIKQSFDPLSGLPNSLAYHPTAPPSHFLPSKSTIATVRIEANSP
jgi:hypothetical protein